VIYRNSEIIFPSPLVLVYGRRMHSILSNPTNPEAATERSLEAGTYKKAAETVAISLKKHKTA
jgi:hypothetical protein